MNLTFTGPCIANIFQYVSNKTQLYTIYLCLKTALHISSGTSTHDQERTQLYLLVLCRGQHTQTSPNSSTIAAGSSNGVTNARCYTSRYSCIRS